MKTKTENQTMKYRHEPDAGKWVCLACGKELYGRTDKKFCNKKCKNKYHNDEYSENCKLRNRVFDVLSINHDILLRLVRNGIESMPLEELEKLGFNARYVTGHRKGLYGHDEYACFNVRYYRTPTRIFKLHLAKEPYIPLFLPFQDPSSHL